MDQISTISTIPCNLSRTNRKLLPQGRSAIHIVINVWILFFLLIVFYLNNSVEQRIMGSYHQHQKTFDSIFTSGKDFFVI